MSATSTGTSPQEQEALGRLREDIAEAERTGRPIFVPDLAAIGLRPRGAGAESADGAAAVDYSEALESICGVVDDSQGVETYDGSLGVTQEFVADHQRQVACVVWDDDLVDHFANPGNVAGAEFGSGTMVSDDLFLTCGHLFDQTGGGWVRPVDDATGTTITPQQIATHMHLRFDYQDQPDGTPRPTTDVPILELLEYRLGSIDMAVCRVPAGTGATFGRTPVSSVDAAVGDMIAIIGHPLGMPKRVEAGPTTEITGNAIRYDDIDTQGGNSGSGIVSAVSGAIVGVHTNGGCNTAGTGSNSGQRIGAILDVSPTMRTVALGGTWVARHGLRSADYQAEFDRLVGRGYRLVDVSGYAVGRLLGIGGLEDRYAATWRHEPGPAWVARHGLSSADYQQAFDELVAQGFRPRHISGYAVAGADRYAAVFDASPAPGAWVARHGLTSADYQRVFDELVPQGFRPTCVSAYDVGGEDRYAGVWEQVGGPAWVARHGLTSAEYQQVFDELVPQGFRPVHVVGYVAGGVDRYVVVFEQSGGFEWVARHGLTSGQYQQVFDELVPQGFRPVQVSGYGVDGVDHYTAIFER